MPKQTDTRNLDLVSVEHMRAIDPNPGRGGSDGDEGKALDIGSGLHQLALRYWSEGRPEDALRVDLEAARIVEPAAPGSALMADVTSTLSALASELRSEGAEQSVLDEADEYIARLPRGRSEQGPAGARG